MSEEMTASRDHYRLECMKADDRAQAAEAEIERLRAALRAICEEAYLLGIDARDWPIKDCEEALSP